MLFRFGKALKKLKLTSQQPTFLYSKDPETGEETVASTAYSNNKGVKTFMAKMNSHIPPYFANDFPNKKMTGLDGNIWKSAKNKDNKYEALISLPLYSSIESKIEIYR